MDVNAMIRALFTGDGFFSVETLSRKVLRVPFMPLQLGGLPWKPVNSWTKTLDIVHGNEGIVLLDAVPRGVPGIDVTLGGETIEGFTPPHFPAQATINAEQIKDRVTAMTGGGSANMEAVLLSAETVIAEHQKRVVRSYQFLWERQRQQALFARITNNVGKVLINLKEKFKAGPQVYYGDFRVGTRNLVKDLSAMKKMSARATQSGGFGKPKRYKLYCFGAAADLIPWNKYLEETKKRDQTGFAAADKGGSLESYLVADNVEIETYDQASTAGGSMLPMDIDLDGGRGVAVLCPILEDYYHANFTPMISMDNIVGPGQELYAYIDKYKETRTSFHMGFESNVAHTIALPDGIVVWFIDDTNHPQGI